VIVTVTLNPALQVRYDADKLELGAVNRVARVRHQASGRGLAVARLLQTFGHEVVVAGLAGGSTGELIRAELARAGVASQFTRIGAESRRALRIADAATGQVTTLTEPAPYITTEELGRLAADFRALLDGADAVVLSGSLPAGLPVETYGSLTSYAVRAGVPVILNAGGSPLREAASRGPALVIPDETAPMDGTLLSAGSSAVVLQTDHGVRTLTGEGEWHAVSRSAGPLETAGLADPDLAASGRRDALVAGFVPGIALGWSWPDILRHAVALAESVTLAGEADLAAYETLLSNIRVIGPRSSAWLQTEPQPRWPQ
jgi:tagatose 6-phosphate kinase